MLCDDIIRFDIDKRTFTLFTQHTSYQMKISEHGHLLHLYYGEKVSDADLSYVIPQICRTHESNPAEAGENRIYSLCSYPQEFSSNDAGDYRVPSVELVNGDGSYSFVGKYKTHRIYEGKYSLVGIPSLFSGEGERVCSLEIDLEDEVTHVCVTLLYGVFYDRDVITRACVLTNGSCSAIRLQRLMSANIDFTAGERDMIEFYGRHFLERELDRKRITHGISEIGSSRGVSGHFHNPFVIVCDPTTGEDNGSAYGFCLVWGGNFVFDAELDGYGQTRLAMGVHPKQFEMHLEAGESFVAPEVVMAYTSSGLSSLSHIYHDAFGNNLCKSKFVKQTGPVLINSWEPFKFTFDNKKILETAKISRELGADMFVLDDGWFGARNNDKAGLGDWVVNEEKMGGSIAALADSIHALGMKFGLWFEPEMVNEDSQLYRAHPDWCLRVPNRAPSRSRHQLCLDLSRDDVCDYIINAVNTVLDSADIDYVKWDYNRYVCDVYSASYPADRQGEIYYRYTLGLYKILDGIVNTHPDVLFEGCSGGGGRFDAALLSYHPQIWCSDDTDAIARLMIHYGTSFAYPVSTMGAHVSVCPNKKTKRTVPLRTRAVVAMHGTYGYELDPAVMSEDERAECKRYTEFFRENAELIRSGKYYRLSSPYDTSFHTSWEFVSKDKRECLVCSVVTEVSINSEVSYVKAKCLENDALYTVTDMDGESFTLTGGTLMNIGILLPPQAPQYTAYAFKIAKTE